MSAKIAASILCFFMATAGLPTRERRSVQMVHSILQSSEQSLGSAAAKITYLGPQEKPIRTVVFSSVGYEPPLDRFAEIQYARRHYQNDAPGNVDRFSATPVEFRQILIAVQGFAKVREGERPAFLSFAVIRKDGAKFEGAEFHIEQAGAGAFYKAVGNALDRENETGRSLLSKQERNILPGE